jgi:hypothetical protein
MTFANVLLSKINFYNGIRLLFSNKSMEVWVFVNPSQSNPPTSTGAIKRIARYEKRSSVGQIVRCSVREEGVTTLSFSRSASIALFENGNTKRANYEQNITG